MPKNRPAPRGFTLIELMIIVAVIGVLTLIAIPKFSSMIRKANETGSKGHLGSIRAAIRLYYMENDQLFPQNFAVLRQAGAKYLSGAIPLYTMQHPMSEAVDDIPDIDPNSDAGRWGYVNANLNMGFFSIQCTHTDASGATWSRY